MESALQDRTTKRQSLFDVLKNGGVIATSNQLNRWVWLWCETTSTGYTMWKRWGWGCDLGTADEWILAIHEYPQDWVIIFYGEEN